MATFVLIPGAGGNASYWSRLVPELERRGHHAIAVDIPEDDPALGLPEYADIVRAAAGDLRDVVLVGQSLGAFTAPMAAARMSLRAVVLVNAMIPLPRETPGQWWAATGQPDARRAADEAAGRDPEFSVETHFLHDVPAEVLAGLDQPREPADTPFGQPCEFDAWPDVPVHVVVGRDDRFFPADFQRRIAADRLGLGVDEIAGGHLVALSQPGALADQLADYVG